MCVCVNFFQMIEPVDVFWKCNKGYLNIPRSLPNGDILIANTGDPSGNSKGTLPFNNSMNKLIGLEVEYVVFRASPFCITGGFIVLDGETFELKGNWENECDSPPSGYDFCYKPCHNVLVSSAGVVPKCVGYGFSPDDFKKGEGIWVQVLSQNSPRWWEGVDAIKERARAGERTQADFFPNGPFYRHSCWTWSICP